MTDRSNILSPWYTFIVEISTGRLLNPENSLSALELQLFLTGADKVNITHDIKSTKVLVAGEKHLADKITIFHYSKQRDEARLKDGKPIRELGYSCYAPQWNKYTGL